MLPPTARQSSGRNVLRSLKSKVPDCTNSHRGLAQIIDHLFYTTFSTTCQAFFKKPPPIAFPKNISAGTRRSIANVGHWAGR